MGSNQLNKDFYGPTFVLTTSGFVMEIPDVKKLKEKAQKRVSHDPTSYVNFTSRPFVYGNVVWRLQFNPYKKIEKSRKSSFTAHSFGVYLEVVDGNYRAPGWTVSVEATISYQIEPDDSRMCENHLKRIFHSGTDPWGFQSNTPWSRIRTSKSFTGWASVKFSKVTCNTPTPTQGPYVSFYKPVPEPPIQNETNTPPCSPPPDRTTSSPPEKDSSSASSSDEKRGEKRKAAEALSNSECPICMDQYADPYVTTCGHTFCKNCIDNLPKDTYGQVKCPLCNHNFYRSSHIKPNFALKDLLSAQQSNPFLTLDGASSSTSSSLSNPTPIDACFNYRQCRAETKLYCVACKLNICADCHEQYHTKTAFTKSHTLCKKSLLCSTHEEQHQYYCSECKSLACVRCAIESHREHQLSLITFQEHVESRRSEIAALISHFPEDIEALNKKQVAIASKIHLLKEREDRVRGEHDSLNALYSEALEAEDDALTLGFEALVSRVQEAAKRKKRK